MGIMYAAMAGLVFWIVAWSLGIKSFDAFMVTMLVVLLAVAARVIAPFLPGNRSDTSDPPSGRSWTVR